MSPGAGFEDQLSCGPWRFLTELPVRLLYILIQSIAELLDQFRVGSNEVMAFVVVARIRP